MTTNFLPDFEPVVTHGTKATVQCLIRDKAVRATPEERIRQRVLHWLIHDTLPDADAAKWRSSRELLANLIHYAIIRTNLREARRR